MNIGLKQISLIILALTISSCACRTRVAKPANIPVAAEASALQDIHFAFDSSAIDALAAEKLVQNAGWLKARPGLNIQIEGHCDERGTQEYNMMLGERRARAAYDRLKALGVEGRRMSTVSYGKELPIDPRHNEEAWAKNRRDHFVVKSGASPQNRM